MRHFAAHRRWVPLATFTVAVLAAVLPAPAGAQMDPLWDHYKAYHAFNFPSPGPLPPVLLIDQFTQYNHDVEFIDLLLNPTEKTVFNPPPAVTYPIHDPLLHYACWSITPQPFTKAITTTDQFGDHTLNIADATLLLSPALKSHDPTPAAGPIPVANHYKCYECVGPQVDVPVRMNDQFGPWNATVLFPMFFCNPAEKRVINSDGTVAVYPIVDPKQHYTFYYFEPADVSSHDVFITDQFAVNLLGNLRLSDILCVPTLKHEVTSTGATTWGKLKVLYR